MIFLPTLKCTSYYLTRTTTICSIYIWGHKFTCTCKEHLYHFGSLEFQGFVQLLIFCDGMSTTHTSLSQKNMCEVWFNDEFIIDSDTITTMGKSKELIEWKKSGKSLGAISKQ